MDEISQLGHVPTVANTASTKEKRLYLRLWRARTAGSLTKEQEAALDKLAQASVTKVVQQVRDLGHYPKASAGRSLAERQLAVKLRRALKAKQLSPGQRAELQALRHASPKQEKELMQQGLARMAEDSARRAEELIQQARDSAPEQEAELQAPQQEPRDARAQGGDAGAGIRRRPAERNEEEDRRLSRRTDAA